MRGTSDPFEENSLIVSRREVVGVLVGVVLVAAACGEAGPGERTTVVQGTQAVSVVMDQKPVPKVQASWLDTSGQYPYFRSTVEDLRRANNAFRAAIVADERRFVVDGERIRVNSFSRHRAVGDWRGVYHVEAAPAFVSGSTAVISALLRVVRAPVLFTSRGPGWLGITVDVASGRRVTIHDLFARPAEGLRALGNAWRAVVRRGSAAECLTTYRDAYSTGAANFSQFALTSSGIAVGIDRAGHCGPIATAVPYSVIRPYLNGLGEQLIAGVRTAR
jgi:hypothetical protein